MMAHETYSVKSGDKKVKTNMEASELGPANQFSSWVPNSNLVFNNFHMDVKIFGIPILTLHPFPKKSLKGG